MYETFLGFHSRPFAPTSMPEQLLFGHSMQKALTNARQCIDRGSGPALIIGAPGVGKSSLMASLAQQYRDQFHIVNMSCSRLDGRQEFLQTALFELRQPYRGFSEGELRLSLLDFLRSDKEKPNGILFLIDDGENLSVEVLDEIRVVSNFVQDGQSRTQLVLAGGYRLEEILNDSRLHSLNQRIAARCFLRNMSHAESDQFVAEHVKRAGGNEQLFTGESLQAIFDLTEGCPRFVNQLCDHVLILCATYGRKQVDAAMVQEAWSDLQCFPDAFPGSKSASSFCQTSNDLIGDQGKWSIIEFGSLDEACSDDQTACQAERPEAISNSNEHWPTNCCNEDDQESNDSRFQGFESESDQWSSSRHDEQEFQSFTTESGTGWKFSTEASFDPYESHTDWEHESENTEVEQPQVHWSFQDQVASGLTNDEPTKESESDNSSTYIASDPFAEQFDEIEVVTSRFASQIAQRNRASQDLTPGDLSCLSSIADACDAACGANLNVVSAFEDDDNNERFSDCTESTNNDLNCTASDSQSCQTNWCVELPQATRPEPVANNSTSTQVEIEADALLQQLSNAFGEPIDHFNQSSQVSHGNVGKDQAYTLRLPMESTYGMTPGAAYTQKSNADAEIQELDSLKQAIEEQNRFSAQAFDRLIVQTNSQSASEGWRIQPVTPQEANVPAFSNKSNQTDDREILICQPSDNVSNELPMAGDRLPFPPTPVSTGRAERMDYQQLFNQLRNLPDT